MVDRQLCKVEWGEYQRPWEKLGGEGLRGSLLVGAKVWTLWVLEVKGNRVSGLGGALETINLQEC